MSRSTVISPHAMIATSHPLAVQAGLDVMRAGGNAIDAAIAAAAVLGVVEPMSTGIGGDLFALVYHAQSRKLFALNASGRAPQAATLDEYRRRGFDEQMPQDGVLSVTVPGAPHGWATLLEKLGTKSFPDLLRYAIYYAQNGFPVSEIVARRWGQYEDKLQRHEHTARTYLRDGRAPRPGEPFANDALARTLSTLAREGIEAFYTGEIAREIVRESERQDGLLAPEDLQHHASAWVDPISVEYRGTTVYEHPPNTQGLMALLALNIVEGLQMAELEHNSGDYLHILIEAIKLAFADKGYIADPAFVEIPITSLLTREYAAKRRALIGEQALSLDAGAPEGGTVYVTAVDEQRNVVSLIESIYMPFGSGVTAGETGILLQNRGALFSLDPEHPNRLEPGKRPYHTIIPAMAFRNDRPWLSFGVVGGFMQPQGHLQLLCNLIDHGMTVQQAIEAPRFRFYEGRRVALEEGISLEVREALAEKGHGIIEGDGNFGGAQAILIDPETECLQGGSDPRKDGCAQGY